MHATRIMLYPYAHLSAQLSTPTTAIRILKGMQKKLSGNFEVMQCALRLVQGLYLSCKGHPLSELSRSIRLGEGEVVSEALKSEAKAVSYWKVLDLEGNLIDADKFDFTGHENLKKFANYEISKARAVDQVPPHVELMRRLELVDYEPGSDPGNMRFYPKGRLIKSPAGKLCAGRASDMGAMEVETPIMYDMEHPTLKKYLDRFPARQYQIDSDKKKLFLRFAACFGQFLMGHDMTVSYKSMPLKMFEITRYSFRREQRGELVGIRRLRAFTMPDMHTLARDMNCAMEEFRKQYLDSISVLREIGITWPTTRWPSASPRTSIARTRSSSRAWWTWSKNQSSSRCGIRGSSTSCSSSSSTSWTPWTRPALCPQYRSMWRTRSAMISPTSMRQERDSAHFPPLLPSRSHRAGHVRSP